VNLVNAGVLFGIVYEVQLDSKHRRGDEAVFGDTLSGAVL